MGLKQEHTSNGDGIPLWKPNVNRLAVSRTVRNELILLLLLLLLLLREDDL